MADTMIPVNNMYATLPVLPLPPYEFTRPLAQTVDPVAPLPGSSGGGTTGYPIG